MRNYILPEELVRGREAIQNFLRWQGKRNPGLGMDETAIEMCSAAYMFSIFWHVPPSTLEELKQSQVFVAYSHGFGPRKDGKEYKSLEKTGGASYDPEIHFPGGSNEDIAKAISDLYQEGLQKPIYAQFEISVALDEKFGIKVPENQVAKKGDEPYFHSRAVLEQFLENGLERYEAFAVFSNPAHLLRAIGTTAHIIGQRKGKTLELEQILAGDTTEVYDYADSIELWTRKFSINEVTSRLNNTFSYHNIDPAWLWDWYVHHLKKT